ncbi:hypothetical protein NIES2104_63910 [Leptolyngbya sp. NIES-2104]|nr:hypothetical protein NIES2104_63910 [Leptolyngbya sp. NIES-2104]
MTELQTNDVNSSSVLMNILKWMKDYRSRNNRMLNAETEQYLHHRFCLIAHHSRDRVTRVLYFAIRFN